MATTTVTYLVPKLRLQLGDSDATAYRYLNKWLEDALLASVESLSSWWKSKYLINDSNQVYRNPDIAFDFDEPPVIQRGDIRPIILMASIIVKSGDLQNYSWDVKSWRDAEISYSNLESSRSKTNLLEKDWEELKTILTPPDKKLAGSQKGHLYGYLASITEAE